MTEPRIFMSPAGRADRRAEFINFYESTYPAVTGELLALTGNVDVARAVAGASYARAWQAWPAVRNLDQPAMWVRADAVRRTRRPPRGDLILLHALHALPEIALDPEAEVLVAALQRLPVEQRLPLVLHYLGQIPVETIVEWFGEQDYEVDARLDSGFDALVEILDWPTEGDSADTSDADNWTAEAFEDCARRFGETIPVPPPTLVFRRGTVKKVTRRGAPITAAAAAAVVGLVAYLSPAPEQTAQAATYAAAPRPAIAERAPAELDPPTLEPTASAPVSPAGTTTRSVARRGTAKKTTKTTKTATGTVVAAVPAVALSNSPVVTTSTTPTSTTPTSTTPTSTTPTTSTGASGDQTGSVDQAVSDSSGTDSSGTDSTGSSVVTTTGSTTPDTTTDETTTDETTTDETSTDESSTATTTRDRDDCPPTTTSTTPTPTTETETTDIETTSLAVLGETNLTTTTTAKASSPG